MSDYKSMAAAGYKRLLQLWTPELITGDGFWHAANVLETMIDYSMTIPNDSENTQKLITIILESHKYYLQVTAKNDGGHNFDDQGWWGLTLLKAYTYTNNKIPDAKKLLNSAIKIWETLNQSAWDDEFCGGGCWWSKSKNYKNSITNELFLTLSTRLYLTTSDNQYLGRITDAYNWFVSSNLITASGLIIDGLNKRDQPSPCSADNNTDTWSYNQGVILSGLVDLNYIGTNNPKYAIEGQFSLAQKIANATTTKLVYSDGILREVCCENQDGTNQCHCDAAQFKGIFMRHLRYLNQSLDNDPYRSFIEQNAQSVWKNRKLDTNEFGQVWNTSYELPSKCLSTNINIFLQSSGLDALVSAIPYSN